MQNERVAYYDALRAEFDELERLIQLSPGIADVPPDALARMTEIAKELVTEPSTYI